MTGFDDIPVARHLHTQLTTVRQRIRELGQTAFEVLYSMINREAPADRDVDLSREGSFAARAAAAERRGSRDPRWPARSPFTSSPRGWRSP